MTGEIAPSGTSRRKILFYLSVILAAGLWMRFFIASRFYGTFDTHSWEKIFDLWRDNTSPYDAQRRYSYGPVWFWVISGVSRLNVFLKLPPHFAVKLPLIFSDVVIALLLVKLAAFQKQGAAGQLWAAALFFLNPVSILNTAYHGQFDDLGYAFVLLACCLNYGTAPKKGFLSALGFYAAIAVKQTVLLLTPVFAWKQKGWGRRLLYFLLAPSLFLLTLAPYFLGKDVHVFQSVLLDSASPRLMPCAWGWSALARYVWNLLWAVDIQSDPAYRFLYIFNYFLYPGLAVAALSIVKRFDIIDSVLVYLLMFYVLTAQMAPQYTVWILPFAALKKDCYLYLYSAVTTVHLLAFYGWEYHKALGDMDGARNFGPIILSFRILSWVITALWLARKLGSKTLSAEPRS